MKGFLSFTVLRLISKKNMSGQEITEVIKKRRGTRPSPGTIYPVLKSLREYGWIEEIKDGGKEKKYRVTKRGLKEVKIATKKFVGMFYDMHSEFERLNK